MNNLQPFSHLQSSNREIGNAPTFLEPQYIQTIENAEQTKRTGLDPNSSMTDIIESTQETSQGDMAEPLQGQSPMTYPVHPHKIPMFAFDALTIQEDFFNACFQQHPGGITPQDAFPSQYDRTLIKETEKDAEHRDIFLCGAANHKTLNNIQQEIQSNFEENIVFPYKPLSLVQFCNSVKLALNPLKKIKSDSSSGLSNEISLTNCMSQQPLTERDLESEDEFQNNREAQRDPRSIHKTFSVDTRAKFTQAFELLDKLQSIEEFEISEKLVALKPDFNFPADIPEDRRTKMEKEIRKYVIDTSINGLLELWKHPDSGYLFQEIIETKDWFPGVIRRKGWFENIFKGQKWYEKAKAENKLLACNHPFDCSSYDESFREKCLAMRHLYALLYGMLKHNININGEPRSELPDNQGRLYQVIGNKRFSPADDINQMGNEEFCKKAASSTLAEFFGEHELFDTYVNNLYESGSNQNTNSTTLTDSEKRRMLIAGKSYIKKRVYNPEKFARNKRGTPPMSLRRFDS